jgi:hypothetical protein
VRVYYRFYHQANTNFIDDFEIENPIVPIHIGKILRGQVRFLKWIFVKMGHGAVAIFVSP